MKDIALSLLPLALLVVALGVLRMTAWKAALGALAVAVATVALAYGETLPPDGILRVGAEGVRFALCPIALVIVGALFAHGLCRRSGALLVIRGVLGNVSADSRVLVLIVAWGFGNFIEGIAGFGTSAAIPAAVLVGCGLDPLRSVLVCLICNATATSYGSVGVGVLALAKGANLPAADVGMAASVVLAVGFLVTPFLMVAAMDGVRALRGVWWLCLAAGLSFVIPCTAAAFFLGPELPDIVGASVSMATIMALGGRVRPDSRFATHGGTPRRFTPYHVLHASSPFALVMAFLALYAFLPPAAKNRITPGAVILVAAMLGGFVQGVGLRAQLATLGAVLRKNAWTILTICAVLAMARIMDGAGMMATLACAITSCTGRAYAFLAPVVGAMGGFITGSGTSANVLFGSLQVNTAHALGLADTVLAGANIFGAGVGKMVCPQSLAIGAAAVGLVGSEGDILKRTLAWFIGLLAFACLVCGLLAFVLPVPAR